MSAYYKLKVLKKTNDSIQVKINLIMPEILEIPADSFWFCIQAIYGGSLFYNKDFPLKQVISEEEIVDPSWLMDAAYDYIEEVKIITDITYKNNQKFSDNNQLSSYINDNLDSIFKVVEIKVTDKKWIEHIKKVMVWEFATIFP